jgi:hypothetical protein
MIRYSLSELASNGDMGRIGSFLQKWDYAERSLGQHNMADFVEMIRNSRRCHHSRDSQIGK